MERVAIIGTGVAGLGCAHFLQRDFEITLFEQNRHVGGHTNTVTARESETGREVPIDTGFMVFNRVTYPNLCRLFEALDVPVKKTDMSFSVRDRRSGLEWCGSSLNHLFAQRRNLFRPRFYRMLMQIDRFNGEALAALDDPRTKRMSLNEYVTQRGYGEDFLSLYLVPMSSAVWSTPPDKMLSFPAASLLRFFQNHGFLGLHAQHQWWTVDGGAREYVKRLTKPFADRIHTSDPVLRVDRRDGRVHVVTEGGDAGDFDRVILATHGDQALRLLGRPTRQESELLSAFKYQANTATLHTDTSVMPKTRLAWASWNYDLDRSEEHGWLPATHYWMNSLQSVSRMEQYFVSINRPELIAPDRVLKTIDYEHPLFDRAAIAAQHDLPGLNAAAGETTRTYFAGSYFRYGFHEDAFSSAVDLSREILGGDPWIESDPRGAVWQKSIERSGAASATSIRS